MISSVLTLFARLAASRRSTSLAMVSAGLLASVVLGGSATAAAAGDGAGNGNAQTTVNPVIHSQTSDRYVYGKYDKTGTYIPPHYQPVAKPRFHGYFFNKEEGGDQTKNQADKKPN